jgi:hypothetical protein
VRAEGQWTRTGVFSRFLGSQGYFPRGSSPPFFLREPFVMDAVYLALTLVLFGLAFALVQLCERV